MRGATGRSINRVLGLIRIAYAHDLHAAPCQLTYGNVQPARISGAEWKRQHRGDNHHSHKNSRVSAHSSIVGSTNELTRSVDPARSDKLLRATMSVIQCPACLGVNIGGALQRITVDQVAEYFIPEGRSRG